MKKFILKFSLLVFLFLTEKLFAIDLSKRYDDHFRKYSKRFFGIGFDWTLFKAQAIAESGLNPDAKSSVGAKGLMQLMPSTFQDVQSANPAFADIDDPKWNIAAGIYYDRLLWKKWDDGRDNENLLNFIFGSYNAGLGTIRSAEKIASQKNLDSKQWKHIEEIAPSVPKWRHEETLNYVKRIKKYHEGLKK
jgi:membrane-bound lytic murein transglycosylase F